MSQQPAQQPSRSRNLPVYVPNTVTRQRYIIRTRAQAQRLGRQPLRDALTNSPTKMPSPNEPLFIHKGGYGSDTLGRKRALSPSMGNAMNISAKRLKPSVPAPAPSNHSAIPVSPIKVTGSARDAPESFVAKPPFTPPRDRTPTQALSTLPTGRPVDHASPRTVRPASIIDIFNTAPVPLQLPHAPPESLGPDPVHERRGGSDVVKSREVPLPAPNLFDISMRTESDQIVQADTSQLRRKYSTLSVDDTMVFDSPSKKATTSIRSTPMARKLSMIPRRVLEPDSVGQSKITSCLFSAAIPAKELASHSSSVVPSGSFPSTSTPSKVTNSLSPSKRSVSSATKHTLGEVPVRPSTSLGFSHPPGRTSLHNSTQASLSNLSMALEKLSIPRVRASLNGPGPVTPVTGGNIERSTARLPIDTKRRSKPPALSSHSLSGRLSGTTLGMRQPAGLNKHPRIGLGRPSGGNMGPPRRALSSMGPPPAPSAAVARATRTASASEATLLGSTPLLSSPPSIDTPDALRISPGEATLSREDKRNRRASIASRSLAEGGVVSSLNQPAEAAISAQNDDGSMDKKKLAILTILKNCVIYVDVRMEDGADAGELFVNMLKGLGARVSLMQENITTYITVTCCVRRF